MRSCERTLAGAGVAIYRFFTGSMLGGVAAGPGGGRRKTAGLLVGILGYAALAFLLVGGYFAVDRWLFHDSRESIPTGFYVITSGAAVLAIGMLFMPVRPFLNFFSLQLLFRRGLRKAYILQSDGGTEVVARGRRLLLTELQQRPEPPDMPYHLIVTSVNTSGDKELKRLGRRSDGFVFAHLHSGSRVTGYARTEGSAALERISLSEAMATSGAAVSPNMGRATTTSNAILMTLLNVRLGTWLLNPNESYTERGSRRPVVWFWLKELFGTASAKDRFIYLTDGGHFDNSAIYELLKRRCKYILAVDASSDIGNLATVARLARIDFGIQMDVDLKPFTPDPASGLSELPYVVARLHHAPVQGDRETEGVLGWVSTARTPDQKPDVTGYAEENREFPFHSTGDQFFDQSQFESYRQLGHTAAGVMAADAGFRDGTPTRQWLEEAMEKLWSDALARRS